MNTKALRDLNYGVYIISAWDTGRPVGCVANSVMQVTSAPPTVMISINHDNYTNSAIKDSGYFAVSILPESVDPGIIGRFGYHSSKEINKFDDTAYSIKGSLPVVDGAMGYLACKVINTVETTSHTLFLGELMDADVLSGERAMTYWYYHNVIKGKSPKNAPTYLGEDEEKA